MRPPPRAVPGTPPYPREDAMNPAMANYERLMGPARERFAAGKGLHTLLQTDLPPRGLERFLIHYCAAGVRMTEPVEGWILRAADRCQELGRPATARALRKHARAESGHH